MRIRGPNLRALTFIAFFAMVTVSNFVRSDVETTVTYYHSNFSGSPVAATSQIGAVLWTSDYVPYGKRYNTTQGADNDVWFTGHVEDDPAGLVYMEARYYDPDIGRFHGIDSVGFVESNPMSFNRYSYANNNPYKYVDPDGNVGVLAPLVVGATLLVATHNAQAPTDAGDIHASFDSKTVDAVGAATLAGSIGKLALKKLVSNLVDNVANTAGKGLQTPEKFFGSKTYQEAEEALTKKFGPPRGGGESNKSFFNEKTKRTYNLHQDPMHRDGRPHIDIRKRDLPTDYYKNRPFFLRDDQ